MNVIAHDIMCLIREKKNTKRYECSSETVVICQPTNRKVPENNDVSFKVANRFERTKEMCYSFRCGRYLCIEFIAQTVQNGCVYKKYIFKVNR